MSLLCDVRHPEYAGNALYWDRWRDVYAGGRSFIDNYVKKLSSSEDNVDFNLRKAVSYNSNYAKTCIDEIKNAIFSRMLDVSRIGGSKLYQTSVDKEVDADGHSMDSFIADYVLPDLLIMQRVGIYIDRPQLNRQDLISNLTTRPYLYQYRVEDILSWNHNEYRELTAILLRDHYPSTNKYGLIEEYKDRYRLLLLTDEGVLVRLLEKYTDSEGNAQEQIIGETLLPLKRIPFVMPNIGVSFMADIAEHQIALLNLESSDMNIIRANFPFYTEQVDWRRSPPPMKRGPNETSDADNPTNTDVSETIKVGPTYGRRYGSGLDRPEFIHPSPEPLLASMKKQEDIKRDMRLLCHLALVNVDPKVASAESKKFDNLGLEAGLAYIGLTLQDAERRIAEIWADYEGGTAAEINYPQQYDLKNDDERRAEVDQWKKILPTVPSQTYAREIKKQIARAVLGRKVSKATMKKIEGEIDRDKITTGDIEYLTTIWTSEAIPPKYIAEIAGLPEDSIEIAEEAHARRVQRLQIAQTPGGGAARGVDDVDADPVNSAKGEKAASRDTTLEDQPTDKTRGGGRFNAE